MLKEQQSSTESKNLFKERSQEQKSQKLKSLSANDPSKVPIIFSPHPKSKLQPKNEIKIFSSRKNNASICCRIIRERIGLEDEQSLVFSCGKDSVIKMSDLVGDLYDKHRDSKDFFLYIQYAEMEAFGNGFWDFF